VQLHNKVFKRTEFFFVLFIFSFFKFNQFFNSFFNKDTSQTQTTESGS